MAILVLGLATLLVLADGCGEEPSREGGTEQSPAPSSAAPQAITEGDNGKSFTLSPGSGTSLRLSGPFVWSEPTLRGDAVELARVDYFQDPGFSEWAVLAVRPGTATIATRGTPQSAGRERSAERPLRFEIGITVEP